MAQPNQFKISLNLIFLKKTNRKLNFYDICSMNIQWQGLLGYLKFLIKRNPE